MISFFSVRYVVNDQLQFVAIMNQMAYLVAVVAFGLVLVGIALLSDKHPDELIGHQFFEV